MQGFRLTRRQLLFTAGSGVLGISVLNTISGCASADDEPQPAGSSAGSTSAAAPAPAGDWKRVDLSFVSAYLLVRGGEAAVVDLGTGGSADAIGTALTAAGSGWKSVRHIVLTHQHDDHAGGLAEVRPLVTAALYAGDLDVQGIDAAADIKPVKDGDGSSACGSSARPGTPPGTSPSSIPAPGCWWPGTPSGPRTGSRPPTRSTPLTRHRRQRRYANSRRWT